MPETGGGGKTATKASGISARTRAFIFAKMAGMPSLGRGALCEILEGQEDGGGVRLVAAEEVEAGEFHGVEHAGRFVRDLRDLVDDGLGAIERGGVGQLRERDRVAAILRGQKAARHDFETERGQAQASPA